MRAVRRLGIAVLAGAAAVALFPVYLSIRAAGSMWFEPQAPDLALLALSTFGIVLGAQLVPWRRERYIPLVALFASGFLLFGFLAAFSIGLAFLPAGLVLLLMLYRALRRRPADALRASAALGGAAMGFAVPLLYIALIIPATVECHLNGGGTSSGRWNSSSRVVSSTGGMSVDPSGVVTGRLEFTDSIVTFRCEQGRLVEFHREPR